jgi:hypothetical protein
VPSGIGDLLALETGSHLRTLRFDGHTRCGVGEAAARRRGRRFLVPAGKQELDKAAAEIDLGLNRRARRGGIDDRRGWYDLAARAGALC